MKTNRFLFGIAAMMGAVALWSCSADEAEGRQAIKSPAAISLTTELATTRTTTDPQTTKLNTAVKVGVFGVNGSTAVTNGSNSSYTVTASGDLSTDKAMTWPDEDEGNISIYAYAPYQSGWAFNADNCFTIASDQSTDEGYLASDLLWGVPAKNPVAQSDKAVPLTFNHMMAKINIDIALGDEEAPDTKNVRIVLNNTLPTTTLNPSTGTLGKASGSLTDITVVAALGSAMKAYGIIVPQQLAADTKFITIDTNPGGSGNKTYVARLGSATAFAAGKQYNFTLKLGKDHELTINPNTTTIANWTDKGSQSMTAVETLIYEVGDYILTDGTFVKAAALTATQKASVAGIIFSKDVSAADAAAGYDAYVMGINRQKRAFHKSDDYPSQMITTNKINDLADAIADLDGRTKTTAMLASDYYTHLADNSKSMLNLDWYSVTKAKAISANASAWYLPSFGQLVQILNNLGGAGFTTYNFGESGFTSSGTYTVGDATALTTLAGKLQAYVTAVGGDGSMFTVGNINYPSCTENGSSSGAHYGKVFSINFTSSGGWNFGKALGRTDSENYSVIPVAAVKLPVTSPLSGTATGPANAR